RVDGILSTFSADARTRTALVDDVLRFTTLFRSEPLYGRLLADEPEAFTRYTLQRVGSSQRMILRWLARAISSAQGDGSVRPGEPQEIAVMLLLIAQSAVLSHGTVADLISEAGWERELRAALDGLLRP
ncbi:TetR/AcrR family transcriptional regulator, partial [Microbacterium sp. BF1]|uniref:TetR/AcrR family transcriptional regulator n=1 Tax=Microbacterium sp. BF1 TaxID=2821146 RepID=UPI001C4E16D7